MKLTKKSFCLRMFLFVAICFLPITSFYAQNSASRDSSKLSKSVDKKAENIEKLLKIDQKNSELLLEENKINRERSVLFDAIYRNIHDADIVLKTGIDYKGFTSELESVISLKKAAIDGVLKNKNEFQTLRNITVTSVLLKELQIRIDIQLDKIRKNRVELSKMQSTVDSLTIDKILFSLPEDPKTKFLYYDRYNEMNGEVNMLNKRFKDALDSISKLQIQGSRFKYELQNDIVETDNIRRDQYNNLFTSEGEIFKPTKSDSIYDESYGGSLVKEFIILAYFITNHIDTISLMFILLIVLTSYLIILKKKYVKEGLFDKINTAKQIFKHPVATSFLIIFTLFNLLFLFSSFAFTSFMWLFSIVALTIVNKEYFNKREKWVWKIYVILILLGLFDNNILIHSVKEVYFILFIAFATASYSFYILKRGLITLNPLFKYSIYGVILFEVLSVFFIIIGKNYNLGKLLMVNGIVILLMYYLFIHTYRLIVIILNYSAYLSESKEERQLDLRELENINFTFNTYILFVFVVIISICKNSYFFQIIVDPIIDFFEKQRAIGDVKYSYETILLFFTIILASVVLAKIVSFLSSTTISSSNSNKTNKFGSWMLLIQITIFTIGISFAFITCGIPMDRLTIIISALGVGIGFGLQTLVNNLVSGLIIAFEKPVNLQDVIEIGGKMVKMKSIGIRSSVVTTFDGADIIIPNGDLLSQQLTNWTLSNNRKRTDIVVGVAYGTDLEKTKMLLTEILKNNPLVLKYPEPIVWVTDFNSSSIDIVVKYWVRSLDEANEAKSQLIIAIDTVLRANNIEIPFPQSDVYLKPIENKESDNRLKEG